MKRLLQKTWSALIISGMIFSARLNAQIEPGFAVQLQQILNDHVQVNGNNGVSACVIMPNGDTWKGSAGVGANAVAITDSSVFHGASITKANIAALILLLAEDGLLNLDSSWQNYVNLNVNFDTTITIRQLISHTSGIADYLFAPGSNSDITNDFNRVYTPVEILENKISGTPDFAPGTNFEYSTSNFVLAAYIAQSVTGHPVGQELHTRIWDPLGMTHTYFGGFENYSEPKAGVWWNFGNGIRDYSNNPETSMLTYGYGGANIVSTPEDLAHFARALFTDQILSQSSMNEMLVFNADSYAGNFAGYGLGIHHAYSFGADSVLGHDGWYTNMADMFHSVDYGFTLVTMTNTQSQWFAIFDEMYVAIRDYITTGITESPASLSVHLFPNPASQNFTITLGSTSKNAEITIADPAGKIMYTHHSTETQMVEVNTKDFAEGVYVVQIQTADFAETKKLVIAR